MRLCGSRKETNNNYTLKIKTGNFTLVIYPAMVTAVLNRYKALEDLVAATPPPFFFGEDD